MASPTFPARPRRSRRASAGVIAALALTALVAPPLTTARHACAWAGDDEADDDETDDDGLDDADDPDADDDPEQPPVTAGGLYTMATYPRGEIQRPLTITQHLVELRIGAGADVSNAHAFDTFGGTLDARYGVRDNLELRAGATCSYDCRGFAVGAAIEGSLDYDLVDVRAGLTLERRVKFRGATTAADDVELSIPIGFPFRYAPAPQVAVTALDTAFAIDLGSKPDVTPSVAITIQPHPVVALILRATARIPDFDFSSDAVQVPASAAVQLTPRNQLDLGAEFRFVDLLVPKDIDLDANRRPDAYYDARFLILYARLRR